MAEKNSKYGKQMVESAVLGAATLLLLLVLRHSLVSPPPLFFLLHLIVGSILFTSTWRSRSPDNLPDRQDGIAAGHYSSGGGGCTVTEIDEAHQQPSAEEVNARVEAFISRFKKQLVLQKGIDAQKRTRSSSCYVLPTLFNDNMVPYRRNKI